MQATILFAHGSSRASWREPFEAILTAIESTVADDHPVRLAFLELCPPTIEQAADELVGLGVTHIQILPLFMSGGGHVLRDLPPRLDQIRARHPLIGVTIQPALGEHPLVLEAIAHIVQGPTGTD